MKKNKKLYYKFKRFFLVFSILCVIFSLAFVPNVYAINDDNSGVLVYNIRAGYSTSITYNPNYSFTSYKTYNYGNSQLEFKIGDGHNGFENSYNRYVNFRLKNGTNARKVVTIKFVGYYGVQGSTIPAGFDGSSYAWVNSTAFHSNSSFKYSQATQNGDYVFNGGQFVFGLYADSDVNIVLCCGFNEMSANVLGYNIVIDVKDYSTSEDILDVFREDNYNEFEGLWESGDDYVITENEVRDNANEYLNNVKSDLFDTNLLNPNVNTPLKGFKALSLFIDKITEIGPLGFIFKMSISFGIIAFVLGLAITIYRGIKK